MQWQSVNGKIVGTSYRMYSLGIILTCIVVLDEAHKYLINSDTARLTQSISSIIRLQRHLSTRVIIATQVGHPCPIVTFAALTACLGAYGHPIHHPRPCVFHHLPPLHLAVVVYTSCTACVCR